MSNNNDNNNIKTFRHEFSKAFIERLSQFSKVHQYDDRHTYKSEWTKWTQREEISQAIETERRRLHENGYTGDVNDKMFKAGRYYFRKKTVAAAVTDAADATATAADATATDANDATATATAVVARTREQEEQQQQQQQQQSRRPYITMSKDAIRLMDVHIRNKHTKAATDEAEKFKPSSCYDDFYQTNMSSIEMTTEIEKIIEKYQKTIQSEATPDQITTEIIDKIKKTYKNRYYKYVSSQQNE